MHTLERPRTLSEIRTDYTSREFEYGVNSSYIWIGLESCYYVSISGSPHHAGGSSFVGFSEKALFIDSGQDLQSTIQAARVARRDVQ